MKRTWIVALAVLALGIAALWWLRAPEDPTLFPAYAAATAEPPPAKPRSAARAERSVFFGDLHIHTLLSLDAYLFGVRAGPEDAYRYAKGGTIEHGAGYPIRLSKPLDFAAVTDHAEYLGMLAGEERELPLSHGALRETLLGRNRLSAALLFASTMRTFVRPGEGERGDPAIMRSAWQRIIDAAEAANDPGVFTAFIGYEWSSFAGAANLHRNVIYRGSRAPKLPFSAVDSIDPEDLWRELAAQSARGIEAIAIPHNGNVSDGLMYADETLDGEPLSADYAERRNRWEPLQEIFQVKGSSETHPVLSSEDEFADFEIKDRLLSATGGDGKARGSYTRDALRRGLERWTREGFDPFDFGVIGSSDGHGASAPVEEDRFHGKLPLLDGTAGIRLGTASLVSPRMTGVSEWGSGGLAAVWAVENTRESLFEAMRRRETYATSGPRIRVRFFAGPGFPHDLFEQAGGIERAYREGVPMGSRLVALGDDSPTLAVWALKDPLGANLDRVQIVKLWIDAEGVSRERIYDVAASDGRTPAPHTGRVSAVRSSVDVVTATYTNTVGAEQLKSVWRDPDFDPSHATRYYARVLEIPTPRWSTYDAHALGVPAPQPTTLQERAVTSAITYLPGARRREAGNGAEPASTGRP